jgi:mannose-6-phosphate isomerase-like protein (cupin superfamily)
MKYKANRVEKEWGHEIWLANNKGENYCGKILHLNKGHKCSMHFHASKHEAFYVLRGKALIKYIDTTTSEVRETVLEEGESFEIDRFLPHQIEATEELDIIESSTFHDDEDSYRVWKD